MAIGTGLGAQLGIGQESTWGTAVAVDHFLPFNQESIDYTKERIESQSLYAGRRTVSDWVAGKEGGAGDIEIDVRPNGGFALLMKHALGANADSQPDATHDATVYRHTAKVGSTDALGLTVQVGRPNTAGTVDPFTWAGCKIAQWELDMQTDGVLTGKFSLDVKSESTVTALATPTYPAANVLLPFSDSAIVFTIGGVTYNVKGVTVTGNNNLAVDREQLGSSTKQQQIEGQGFREITGTIDLESYAGLTPYNLFKNGTEAAIVATFTGAPIDPTFSYAVAVTMTRCRFDGNSPKVGGPAILDHQIPFKALYTSNAATEVQVVTTNTDATP